MKPVSGEGAAWFMTCALVAGVCVASGGLWKLFSTNGLASCAATSDECACGVLADIPLCVHSVWQQPKAFIVAMMNKALFVLLCVGEGLVKH